MFISRKTLKLASLKNKISNSQVDGFNELQLRKTHSGVGERRKTQSSLTRPEAEVSRYPVFNYLLGVFLAVCFIYLIYSVNGGTNSLPGFNERKWWQYLLATVPLLISLLLFFFSQLQKVTISGQLITFTKAIMLGLYKTSVNSKEAADLVSISIIKKGVERVTFTNSSYFLVFNFRPFDEIEALEAGSEITATDYLQTLKAAVPQLRHSTQKISIKNIVIT